MRALRDWRLLLLLALLAAALLPLCASTRAADETARDMVEWPRQWDGVPLRPLALSAVEERFAARFPGRIARFDNGAATLVLREVRVPTRMLHPATDCYRGLGYRIELARLERDRAQRLWRCFTARRDGSAALRVCERIEAPDGQVFTDGSAWFWAATLRDTTGPWRAVTTVRPL